MKGSQNLAQLSNYLQALMYFRHIGKSRLAQMLPRVSETWFNDLRKSADLTGMLKVDQILSRIAPILHVSPTNFSLILKGNAQPIKTLINEATYKVHDRKSLRYFLNVVAYTHGMTLVKISHLMGRSTAYINTIANLGTRERMRETLLKNYQLFGIPKENMAMAIEFSDVHHREFAGGYFGGNRTDLTKDDKRKLKTFAQSKIKSREELDSIYSVIDQAQTKPIVQTLVKITLDQKLPISELEAVLKDARMSRYIPLALKLISNLEQHGYLDFHMTDRFKDNIKSVDGHGISSRYVQTIIVNLRRLIVRIRQHKHYKKITVDGMNLIETRHCTQHQAYYRARKSYSPKRPPKWLAGDKSYKYYERNRKNFLNSIYDEPAEKQSHGWAYLYTVRRIVINLGGRTSIYMDLHNFSCENTEVHHMHSLGHVTFHVHHKATARVKKMMRKLSYLN